MHISLRYAVSTVLGVFALAQPASAGLKDPGTPVNVVPTAGSGGNSGYAFGSIGSTRSGGTASSYLGCYMVADLEWGNTAICEASDGTDTVSCRLDPLNFEYHLAAIRSMTPSSYIEFDWEYQTRWAEKICTTLIVRSYSVYSPPQ